MRIVSEQKQEIEELRTEVRRLTRLEEAVRPAQRCLTYADAYEAGKGAEEQPFRRHSQLTEARAKPVVAREIATELESLE